MAQTLHSSFLLVYFFLVLSFTVAFSSSKRDYPGLKSLHLTVYDQDTINKTIYTIVNGVNTGVGGKNQDFGTFGTILAFHDPVTIKPESSSKVVGAMEGITMISGLDGLRSINVIKMTLSLKNHKGSLSIVGAVPNVEPGDLTVVGGTGDFMFVQGYVTTSLVQLALPYSSYKFDFHLYWPPYATF